jgi:anti-repressor protein
LDPEHHRGIAARERRWHPRISRTQHTALALFGGPFYWTETRANVRPNARKPRSNGALRRTKGNDLNQHTIPQPQAVAIAQHQTEPAPVQTLDARLIHAELGVRHDFNHWMRLQIEKHSLTESVDFFGVSYKKVENPQGGRPSFDYALTQDAAVQIAAAHNSSKGRQMLKRLVRELKSAKATTTTAPVLVEHPTSPAALQKLEDRLSGIEGTMQAVADAVRSLEAFGPVDEIAGTYSIDDAAKMLRIAPDSMWLWLRQEKFLTKTTPAQRWIDSGHLTLKPSPWTHKETGERHIYLQPRVTAKGIVMLRKRLESQQEATR